MNNYQVAVLDMQPIDPSVGGGRLRLLGLYGGFKNNIDAIYVGTYDWRGPKYRDHQLTDCLREIDVPLSEEHFVAHDKLATIMGKGCIDSAFPLQASLSHDFISKAKEVASKADVVIFSHQWLFSFVADNIDTSRQLVIYDSHNCEGLLRVALLDNGSAEADKVCRAVVRSEYELCHAADIIFACSEEDKQKFVKYYGIDKKKIIIVPNGVFTSAITPCEDIKKSELRKRLGLNKPSICFVGSGYGPNIEAAKLILEAAKLLPQYQFVILGGVGDYLKEHCEIDANVIVTGLVDERLKIDYLTACDIAVNPMLAGSGVNIKMFDFMAAGLPIVTTDIGARGIQSTSGSIYQLCGHDRNSLVCEIVNLLTDKESLAELRSNALREVNEKYSWEQISYELGYKIVQAYHQKILNKHPYYSVIIPTYERHDLLEKLLQNLQKQTFKDFEVVIVDQSNNPCSELNKFQDLNITYFKTTIKGATKARNTGIRLAIGEVVAFIDDDCIPDQNWLNNAHKYLQSSNNAGIEGLIKADIYDDIHYRTVSNLGTEGIGFMTANLFVRRNILIEIGGFDESFDNPHFREDTDLGWRALKYGKIPYASDVTVLHPSHKRSIDRESAEERNKFYIHDPLLFKKHGRKFIDLMLIEKHYTNMYYWKYFMQGIKRHKLPIYMLKMFFTDVRVDKTCIPDFIRTYKQ